MKSRIYAVILIVLTVTYTTQPYAETFNLTFDKGWATWSPWFTSDQLVQQLTDSNIQLFHIDLSLHQVQEIDDANTIVAGKGYWAYAEEAASIVVTGDPIPETDVDVAVASGWNLLGNPYGKDSYLPCMAKLDSQPLVDSSAKGSEMFVFANDSYSATDTLRTGGAFWLKSTLDTQFNFSVDGAYVCGDGFVAPLCETCDDGELNGTPGYCNATCSAIIVTDPVCGNGTKEFGEYCDDGNTDDGDGCSSTCWKELPPFVAPTFSLKWGSRGSAVDQFYNPLGIDHDADGFIYVVDTGKSDIKKFEGDGTYVATFADLGGSSIQYICVDPVTGMIGVTKIANPDPSVTLLDASGNVLRQICTSGDNDDQCHFARECVFDNEGNLYVADADFDASIHFQVKKFDPDDGTFLGSWGEYGEGDGQFHYLSDLDIDSAGYLYVVDSKSGKIQKFTPDGESVPIAWGYALVEPRSVTVDANDRIYVLDRNDCSVRVFDPDGTSVGSVAGGCTWFQDNQFADPASIITIGDALYVSDPGSSDNLFDAQVRKFTP